MAQWITHLTTNQKIAGSSPARIVKSILFQIIYCQWILSLTCYNSMTITYSCNAIFWDVFHWRLYVAFPSKICIFFFQLFMHLSLLLWLHWFGTPDLLFSELSVVITDLLVCWAIDCVTYFSFLADLSAGIIDLLISLFICCIYRSSGLLSYLLYNIFIF